MSRMSSIDSRWEGAMRDLAAMAALNRRIAVRRRWRERVQWWLGRRPRGVWGWVFGDMT
jgi:hypothetical protein